MFGKLPDASLRLERPRRGNSKVENAQELSLDLPARRRPMSRRRVTGAAPPVAQF